MRLASVGRIFGCRADLGGGACAGGDVMTWSGEEEERKGKGKRDKGEVVIVCALTRHYIHPIPKPQFHLIFRNKIKTVIMSSSKTIVVAFDLYGTLLSTDSIAKELSQHFGPEKAQAVSALWRRYQLEYTWRLNSMSESISSTHSKSHPSPKKLIQSKKTNSNPSPP